MSRHLYLAAYDITDPGRLHQMLVAVKAYATGGQKSVFECWLNTEERHHLLAVSNRKMDLDKDRFFILRLDPRQRPILLGLALPLADPCFYYQG